MKRSVEVWINYVMYLGITLSLLSLVLYSADIYLGRKKVEAAFLEGISTLNKIYSDILDVSSCYECSRIVEYKFPPYTSKIQIFLTPTESNISIYYVIPKKYGVDPAVVKNKIDFPVLNSYQYEISTSPVRTYVFYIDITNVSEPVPGVGYPIEITGDLTNNKRFCLNITKVSTENKVYISQASCS